MKKRIPLSELHQNTTFDFEDSEPVVTKSSASAKSPKSSGKVLDIPINQIELDENIRDTYVDDSLDELGESIIANGQIQPVVVTERNGKYVVKVGHRRVKACLLREIPTVRCIVEDDFDGEKQRIIIQAIENEQRLNLSSREREAYIARLVELGMTQTEIAKALNKTKGWVSEALTSFNVVNENKELFDALSEEPSTRDAWKASTLTKDQLRSAVAEARESGGTKDAFKKAVTRRYKLNASEKNDDGTKKVSMSHSISLDENRKTVKINMGKCDDPDLGRLVKQAILRFYKAKGYSAEN